MGERTGIEWADATWNPFYGCTKVSPGCKNCYMYREMERYGRDPYTVTRAKPATFNAPLKWREPQRIFTCIWSDFFHETADPWRDEAWEIIARTPQHTYIILPKRPERMHGRIALARTGQPLRNVWLGVSVETEEYRTRIDYLAATPAVVRFVSAHPLLGPLN